MTKEALTLARQLLWRYRHETPIGNQPHMICQEADEAFEHIDEALKQPEFGLKPRCFADFQPNHEHDRKCQWCAIETECKTGMAQPEQEPRIPLFEVMSNTLELYEFDQSVENHGALMQAVHNYVAEKEKPDDGYCQACDGEMCTAKKGCVALDNPQPKEPEQEPVAYCNGMPAYEGPLSKTQRKEPEQEEYLSKAYRLANELRCHLAIAPAPQRKPLTDEEIGAILEGVNAYGTRLYTFARAIEAAHNIKE